jgi:hypothetical protein
MCHPVSILVSYSHSTSAFYAKALLGLTVYFGSGEIKKETDICANTVTAEIMSNNVGKELACPLILYE